MCFYQEFCDLRGIVLQTIIKFLTSLAHFSVILQATAVFSEFFIQSLFFFLMLTISGVSHSLLVRVEGIISSLLLHSRIDYCILSAKVDTEFFASFYYFNYIFLVSLIALRIISPFSHRLPYIVPTFMSGVGPQSHPLRPHYRVAAPAFEDSMKFYALL